jgi:alcohol dehydrogenase class IV
MGGPARAKAAVLSVRSLNAEVGIPERLSSVGVTSEYFEVMARDAFESGNAQIVNPRKPTYSEVLELYQQSL